MIPGQLRMTCQAVIILDKMETYAEILVTVGVTALLRPPLSSNRRPTREPPCKLSTGTEASISIGTSFLAPGFYIYSVSFTYYS